MKPEYKIIADIIEKNARVLDVGCDDGTLMEFLKKNKKKRIVILDIPLLLENKINKKDDILIFIQSDKKEKYRRIMKWRIRSLLPCIIYLKDECERAMAG